MFINTFFQCDAVFHLPRRQEAAISRSVHIQCRKRRQKAVDESKNKKWKLQLSAAMIKGDAHLIDVKYNLTFRGHKPATAHLIKDSTQTGKV